MRCRPAGGLCRGPPHAGGHPLQGDLLRDTLRAAQLRLCAERGELVRAPFLPVLSQAGTCTQAVGNSTSSGETVENVIIELSNLPAELGSWNLVDLVPPVKAAIVTL